MRTIFQIALSSVISDIQSRLSNPAVVGLSLGGGGHVPATLRSSYLLVITDMPATSNYCDQILLIGTKYS